jgi:hypothetical protein
MKKTKKRQPIKRVLSEILKIIDEHPSAISPSDQDRFLRIKKLIGK